MKVEAVMSVKRILLKLSGEILMGSLKHGISHEACHQVAINLQEISNNGYEVGVVIGGGNIFRGIRLNEWGMERTPADHMGMVATLLNGLALQEALHAINCQAQVMSALECPQIAESYNWQKALKYLSKGVVTIFVGGTGNPYFTTDTAAALRASEIHADLLLKATKVDGVYDQDPHKHSKAKRYTTLSYSEYITKQLGVMDVTAVTLCMNNKIPIFVFNMQLLGKEPIATLLSNQQGTLIQGEGK